MGVRKIVILSGPNGAGKTTASSYLLRDALRVDEFVNADAIASGLSAFAPESVALEAGRIMLGRIRDLIAAGASFGFETTLNLFGLYIPIVTRWNVLNNYVVPAPPIARGTIGRRIVIAEQQWKSLAELSQSRQKS